MPLFKQKIKEGVKALSSLWKLKMIQHSKLPWAITTTSKGSKQITDARGSVVANLTALDMSNAELIVSSVNGPSETIKYITDPKELMLHRRYWLVSRVVSAHPEPVKIERCMERDGRLYFRNYLWAFEGNNQAMFNYDIYGPVPEETSPDFETLKAIALTKK